MGTFEGWGWVDRRRVDVRVGRDRRNRKARRLGDTEMTRNIADWFYRYRWWPWLLIAFVAGFVIIPDSYDKLRFWVHPVVRMSGTLISKTPDSAKLRMSGEKLRGIECEYLGIQAFGDRLVGLPVDLIIRRTDMPSEGLTKPAGSYDIGTWEVRPTISVVAVRVYVLHNCEGYRVAAKIADVAL